MTQSVSRMSIEMGKGACPANEKVLVVYSPAGGNGKSEIAANIAYYLAKTGYRIWLIDANTHAPTLDLILCAPELDHDGLVGFLKDTGATTFPVSSLSPRCIDKGTFQGQLLFTPSGTAPAKEAAAVPGLGEKGKTWR